MLEKELNFFVSNQTDLAASYKGKVLVIKGQKVVGVYKDALEAYFEAQKQYELGTFMLQPCEPGEEAYTVFITSNELFKQKKPIDTPAVIQNYYIPLPLSLSKSKGNYISPQKHT